MERNFWLGSTLLTVFFINLSSAYADIGGIGSPVVPSNLPPPAKTGGVDTSRNHPASTLKTSGNSDSTEAPSPILVIEFNQRHVYFERELKQAISSTEANQAGAMYEIISRVPSDISGKLKIEHLNDDYGSNLDNVVSAMQELGVPPGRIHSSTEQADDITTQQISITVQ